MNDYDKLVLAVGDTLTPENSTRVSSLDFAKKFVKCYNGLALGEEPLSKDNCDLLCVKENGDFSSWSSTLYLNFWDYINKS